MATKTTTKSDPTFAAAIERVQPALTAWRQRRKHREPIPEPLWRAMVRLARRYGLSRVAQVLRVNYTALKHRLVATAAPQVPRSGAIAAEFVEVPMTARPNRLLKNAPGGAPGPQGMPNSEVILQAASLHAAFGRYFNSLLSRNYAEALHFLRRSTALHRGPPQLGADARRA